MLSLMRSAGARSGQCGGGNPSGGGTLGTRFAPSPGDLLHPQVLICDRRIHRGRTPPRPVLPCFRRLGRWIRPPDARGLASSIEPFVADRPTPGLVSSGALRCHASPSVLDRCSTQRKRRILWRHERLAAHASPRAHSHRAPDRRRTRSGPSPVGSDRRADGGRTRVGRHRRCDGRAWPDRANSDCLWPAQSVCGLGDPAISGC